MLKWFPVFPRKKQTRIQLIPEDSYPGRSISVTERLEALGIGIDSFVVNAIDEEKDVESTESFLTSKNIDQDALLIQGERTMNQRSRIRERAIVLWALVVPMTTVPIGLIILLMASAFGKAQISEKIQIAYLTAITGDFLGLCYVVTRDLFPQGDIKDTNDDN